MGVGLSQAMISIAGETAQHREQRGKIPHLLRLSSLGREDPLEKKWLPRPVFLPREFHGEMSLVGYSP